MTDAAEARATLDQLASYTERVCKFLGVDYQQGGRNSYGPWAGVNPIGMVNHYTASNMAVGKKRPHGRLPVMANRFARGSKQKVGVHGIVWDRLEPRFEEIRKPYDLLEGMSSEVLFFGDDLSFWHAGWVNRQCLGVEIRNCGQLFKKGDVYQWKGQRYRGGRQPLKIGNSWWEPYTREQMEATLWLERMFHTLHTLQPEWFINHMHVSSTRLDAGPHFPIHEFRRYVIDPDLRKVPLNKVPFLQEFHYSIDLPSFDKTGVEDPLVSEEALHKGLYRQDWDGTPDVGEVNRIVDSGETVDDEEGLALGEVAETKKKLRSLGYYPGPTDLNEVTPEYVTTVELFQSRWKKRARGSGRLVQEMPITGKMDAKTRRKLEMMIRMVDRL